MDDEREPAVVGGVDGSQFLPPPDEDDCNGDIESSRCLRRLYSLWNAWTYTLWWKCCPHLARSHERRQQTRALRALSQWNARIFPSPLGGVGLFALRHLDENAVAVTYESDLESLVAVSRKDSEAALQRLEGPATSSSPIRNAVSDLYYSSSAIQWLPLRPPASLSFAGSINHSSTDPNLVLEYDEVSHVHKYRTIRPVKAMEEFTMDYRVLVREYGDNAPGLADRKYLDPDRWFQIMNDSSTLDAEASLSLENGT